MLSRRHGQPNALVYHTEPLLPLPLHHLLLPSLLLPPRLVRHERLQDGTLFRVTRNRTTTMKLRPLQALQLLKGHPEDGRLCWTTLTLIPEMAMAMQRWTTVLTTRRTLALPPMRIPLTSQQSPVSKLPQMPKDIFVSDHSHLHHRYMFCPHQRQRQWNISSS